MTRVGQAVVADQQGAFLEPAHVMAAGKGVDVHGPGDARGLAWTGKSLGELGGVVGQSDKQATGGWARQNGGRGNAPPSPCSG